MLIVILLLIALILFVLAGFGWGGYLSRYTNLIGLGLACVVASMLVPLL